MAPAGPSLTQAGPTPCAFILTHPGIGRSAIHRVSSTSDFGCRRSSQQRRWHSSFQAPSIAGAGVLWVFCPKLPVNLVRFYLTFRAFRAFLARAPSTCIPRLYAPLQLAASHAGTVSFAKDERTNVQHLTGPCLSPFVLAGVSADAHSNPARITLLDHAKAVINLRDLRPEDKPAA